LSAKLVPTFADRGVSHGQCGGSPTAVFSIFLDRDNIDTVEENTDILLDASGEAGLVILINV
jgi:hypothetical protein